MTDVPESSKLPEVSWNPKTPRELARFLDRVRHLYPRGIPREAFTAPAASTGSAQNVSEQVPERVSVYFVLCHPETAFSDPYDTLLSSIITRGLELSTADAAVRVLADPDDVELRGALSSIEVEYAPRLVICMGSKLLPSGSWSEEAGRIPVLHTRSIVDVANDKSAKREYWEHLKGVLARLEAARVEG